MLTHEWQTCSVFPGCCSQCEPGSIQRREDLDADGVWRKRPARGSDLTRTIRTLTDEPKAGVYR